MKTILPDATDNRKTSLLPAALALVARDFSVFPCYSVLDPGTPRARCACKLGDGCASPGKHPIGATTRGPGSGGVKVATKDKAQLRDWWGRWPTLNPAIRTGERDLVVLDVDGAAGFETIRGLEERLGALPPTLSARSGRVDGGEHRWFRAPALAALGSRKIAPGLDLKARDGYVVAPGAVHKSGTRYAWTTDLPVAELPAEWLAWAETAIQEKTARETFDRPRFVWTGDPDDRAGAILAKLAAAPEGGRNDALNEAAYTLGGLYAANRCPDLRARLFEVGTGLGLDERETTATIRSGWEAGAKRPLLARPSLSPEQLAAHAAWVEKKKAELAARRAAQGEAPAARATPPVAQAIPHVPSEPAPASVHRDVKPGNVLPEAPPSDPVETTSPPAVEEAPWERFERERAEHAKRFPRAECDLAVGAEIAAFATRIAAAVKELSLAWDDARYGARHTFARAASAAVIFNEVGTDAAERLIVGVDNRLLGDDENPADLLSLGLEATTFYARRTLRRVAKGEDSHQAVQALNDLFPGYGLGTELAQRAVFWKPICPLEPELLPYEKEKQEHARAKKKLLEVIRLGHEGGVAIPEDVEATLIAGANCSDYVQTHEAECCGVCYCRAVRVCELYWCKKCGPKIRAEEIRLAQAKWAETHPEAVSKKRLSVAIYDLSHVRAVTRLSFKQFLDYVQKQMNNFPDGVQQTRMWFASPFTLVFVSEVEEPYFLHRKNEDAWKAAHCMAVEDWFSDDPADREYYTHADGFPAYRVPGVKTHVELYKTDIAGALAVVQRVRRERTEWVHRELKEIFLAAHLGERAGDTDEGRKQAELCQKAIKNLTETGWLRDVHWYGGTPAGFKAFPWPSRTERRKALKELAAKERGQPIASAKPPERCPAHGGNVPIAIFHVPTKRAVARNLRFPCPLLEAVRLDPQRNATPPPRKRRPLSEKERLFAITAADMKARFLARTAAARE